MTRRAPPTQSRTRPENTLESKGQISRRARPQAIDFMSESEAAGTPNLDVTRQDDRDSDASSRSNEEDIDVPRAAQWIDDDDDDDDGEPQAPTWNDSGSDSDGQDDSEDNHDHSAAKVGSLQRLRSLEEDLSTLPLGTLRNAQRSLAQAQDFTDSEDHDEEEDSQSWQDDEDDVFHRQHKASDGEAKSRTKPKSDLAKRANKHAPTEVTSKRPVSRRRAVVDDCLPRSRDPRFVRSAGRYDVSKFKQRYDFLSSLRQDELSTLREHVKRARRLVVNAPSHLRAERENEMGRLERALKRAESSVNTDNRERVELDALRTAKQTEKEKRKQGKAQWWMKRSERKQLLAKARLDAIAAVGGKQAVKKAVEKKHKKMSQKEKKMRPFQPRSSAIESSDSKRRRPVDAADLKAPKRRKVV